MICNRRIVWGRAAKMMLLWAVATTAWGQACQQQVSDSSFAAMNGSGNVQGFVSANVTVANSGSPNLSSPSLTYQITRVVGPGTAAEIDTNGFLKNWDAYVQNGILSRYACITVGKPELIDGGVPGVPVNLTVYVNGRKSNDHTITVNLLPECGNLLGCSGSLPLYTKEGELKILTKYLKFPQRAPGGQPTAAVNNIVIVMQPGTPIDHVLGAFLVGNLTLKAMAPIVLVHGIRADNTWFPTSGFTLPLDAARAPYVIAIKANQKSLDPSDIYSTGTTLQSVIPALAKEFGATKVHIVAHSKGGLWSRFFLGGPGGPYSSDLSLPPTPANFGALSLITLDTPHHGSFLADIAVASQFWRLFPISPAGTLTQTNPLDPMTISDYVNQLVLQISDLTRAEVELFNNNFPGGSPGAFEDVDGAVYPTVYRTVAADADIGDKTTSFGLRFVDATDCAGMPLPTAVCGVLYQVAGAEDDFSFAALVVGGHWNLAPFVPQLFNPNDLVVTQRSARFEQSPVFPVHVILDPLRKNHSTVGDACVAGGAAFFSGTGAPCTTGKGVLGAIQEIQPVN